MASKTLDELFEESCKAMMFDIQDEEMFEEVFKEVDEEALAKEWDWELLAQNPLINLGGVPKNDEPWDWTLIETPIPSSTSK